MMALPKRKTSHGEEIETRPLNIEEWLDSLPYIDFQKTASLINQALIETNKADIKSATRLDLMALYNRPYQYYVQSQIKAGAQHTLQTIDAVQSQVSIMKQIAVNMSFSCKLAFDKALNQKTLWKQSKPPIEAMLMSMNYLSHALIFSFLEYSPVPKNVWQQLNFIYDFAESKECQKNIYSIPGAETKDIKTSIDHTYKRILMASLVDPHHLPFGAIWEIYEQLDSWAEYTKVSPMQTVTNPSGYFVLDLKADQRPIPYSKFNLEAATNKTRLLDSTPLENLIQKQLELINMGQVDNSIVLSPFYAKSLLAHMLRAWGLPPKRHFPRSARKGELMMSSGFTTTYYFLNGKQAFVPPELAQADDEIDVAESSYEQHTPVESDYFSESWRIVDEGSGGYAIIRSEKPEKPVRVGDIVGINLDNENWSIGVIRWLMISRQVHKLGIQNVADKGKAIALRARNGSQADRTFRAAFLINQDDSKDSVSIVAEKGLYLKDREMEIVRDGKSEFISAKQLQESSISFEIFTFKSV